MSARWRRYFRPLRTNLRGDVDDEFSFHIEMLAQELVRAGWQPSAARAEAERRFGAVAPVRDACVTIDERRHRRENTSFRDDFVTLVHNRRRAHFWQLHATFDGGLGKTKLGPRYEQCRQN